MLKVLQPRHFSAFRCIGADCEDTCCDGLSVMVDKRTFESYQDVRDTELSSSLHSLVTINPAATGDDDHAKIALTDSRCPFLSEGLCGIQKRLGEAYLSDMCATYPRVLNRVDDVLQKSLDLSCPEAARLVLLNPAGIEFDEAPYVEGSVRGGKMPALDTAGLGDSPESYRSFREIRHEVIAMLQNRSYSLTQRLLNLGCLCDSLHDTAVVPDQHLAAPAVDQLEIVLQLIVSRISSDFTPRRFLDCYREFMQGIHWTAESTMEEIGSRYAESYAQHYAPFMNRHEYLLENYLVNYVHRTLFPFGLPESNLRLRSGRVESSLAAQYMLMVAYYAITKTVLIGMAGYHKEAFGVEHVVKLVQSCTRAFEHSVSYPGKVIEILAGKGMTTPAALCVLMLN